MSRAKSRCAARTRAGIGLMRRAGLRMGGLFNSQVWPDQVEVIGPKLFSRDLSTGSTLNCKTALRGNGSLTARHLRQVGGRDAQRLREGFSIATGFLDVGSEVHIQSLLRKYKTLLLNVQLLKLKP